MLFLCASLFGCLSNEWYHLGVGVPPIFVYFSGWIGMFTGGTIWLLTHGHLFCVAGVPFLSTSRRGIFWCRCGSRMTSRSSAQGIGMDTPPCAAGAVYSDPAACPRGSCTFQGRTERPRLNPLSHQKVPRDPLSVIFVAFCLDVRTLTFCQRMGLQ